MKQPSFSILLASLVAVFVVGAVQSASAKQPNVLLILADDLGFSDLGCFGGDIETPHLDSLAKGGVRLTQFYNTGRCCPSRASFLTGQYPHRVGLGHMTQDIGRPGYKGAVSPETATIAEALQLDGYRTFLSGKWHLGTKDPTKHGFEEFYGTLVSAKTFWDQDHFLRMPEGRKARRYKEGEFYGTDALVDHAIDFLGNARETKDKPWFLYLAFNAPHFPLHAPEEDIKKYEGHYTKGWDKIRAERLKRAKKLGIVDKKTKLTPLSPYWNYGETETGVNPAWDTLPKDRQADLARRMAIYAAMVDRMDQNIGRLLRDLKANGELDNTFILFTSDNGACAEWDPRGFDIKSSNNNKLHTGAELTKMGSKGTYHSAGSGWANTSNTPWRLYKHFNHEGGVASPGIAHWSGLKRKAGSIEHQPTHIIDVLPTVLDVAGSKAPKKIGDRKIIPPAGESMLSVLNGKKVDRTLYFEHEGNRAIREGNWKLVALKGQPWELYRIDRDRTELNDLSSRNAQRVERMEKKWLQWAEANHVAKQPIDLQVKYLKAPEN